MNYGGEAADQVIRYSLDGVEHSLRISGNIAKNLAVFIVAVLKDQKKTRGKTTLIRMLKEQKATKFFSIPQDRLKEFAKEAKSRGLLYVVIRDKKNPDLAEIMVFADDAAKVNRVLDQMNLDFVKSEVGTAEPERSSNSRSVGEKTKDSGKDVEVKTEKIVMPEGTIEFEINENEHIFDVGEISNEKGNFTQAKEAGNPSELSSRNNDFSSGQENSMKKPSVRQELKQIKDEKKRKPRKKSRGARRNKNRKVKGR